MAEGIWISTFTFHIVYNILHLCIFCLPGEELSKKQATQEGLIRKLRAQVTGSLISDFAILQSFGS